MIDGMRSCAGGRGRHAVGGGAAIPVSVLLALGGPATSPANAIVATTMADRISRVHESTLRPRLNPVLAMATAGVLALAPLAAPTRPGATHVAAPAHADIGLIALVRPSEVIGLVQALDGAMNSTSQTVARLVGTPGQTVAGALKAAAFVNNVFFELLQVASPSAVLKAAFNGLRVVNVHGLTRLANSVGALNSDLVLTTKQMSALLTTALTGSLGTVIGAVTDLVNNPLSLPRYAGLVDAPLTVSALVLNSGIGALNYLGVNVLSAVDAVVGGALRQIDTALDAVDGAFGVGHALMPNAALGGVLAAVHGVVTSPLHAVVNGAVGLSTAVTDVAANLVSALADTATADVRLWMGDGTSAGALQRTIDGIAAAPLSIGSYAHAVSTLVTATIATVTTTVGVGAEKLAAIPLRFAADLTTAGSSAINALISGVATVAAGLLQAAGVPARLYNLSHGVAQVAIWVSNHIVGAIKGAIDGVATKVAHALDAPATSVATQVASTAVNFNGSAGRAPARPTAAVATPVGASADSTPARDARRSARTARPGAAAHSSATGTDAPSIDRSSSTGRHRRGPAAAQGSAHGGTRTQRAH